jgi:integrase
MPVKKRTTIGANGKPLVRFIAVHYTPDGREKSKSFARESEAKRYLTSIESTKMSGAYIDPDRGRLTLGGWSTLWLEGHAKLAPSTRERYAGILREHVVPRWGHVRLAEISHAEVQAWLGVLARRLAPATVAKIHRVLSLCLSYAVKDDRLARNVAQGVNLPDILESEHLYLTHDQLDDLAAACGDPVSQLVTRFLGYTGLRFGEMAALRVNRLDFLRRRAKIVESVTPVRGALTWGPTKGKKNREVPLPTFLVEDLAAHVETKAPGDLVFLGERGGIMRAQKFQRHAFTMAAAKIAVPGLTPHELRHTAASLAIASGADIKVVQTMLGHESAMMTWDLYGHLYGDRLDEVALAMDLARTRSLDARALARSSTVADLDSARSSRL